MPRTTMKIMRYKDGSAMWTESIRYPAQGAFRVIKTGDRYHVERCSKGLFGFTELRNVPESEWTPSMKRLMTMFRAAVEKKTGR